VRPVDPERETKLAKASALVDNGMSQRKAAEAVGVSPTSLSRALLGRAQGAPASDEG
jgi:DNA-binding transcriptional regulator YdaS (Cro superfamily)